MSGGGIGYSDIDSDRPTTKVHFALAVQYAHRGTSIFPEVPSMMNGLSLGKQNANGHNKPRSSKGSVFQLLNH